jgi:hypothetical protein
MIIMKPSRTEKDGVQMEENVQEIWTARIRAYQASGQTMKAWSAEHNVTLHQLKYWLYKAQRQDQVVSPPTFRPVTIATPKSSPIASLQIQVGIAQIHVQSGFEPGLLRDVVAALTPLC